MAVLVSDQWTVHWRIEIIPTSEHSRNRYGAIGGEECSWDNRLAVSVTMSAFGRKADGTRTIGAQNSNMLYVLLSG